jgi:hypothetical protein
MGLRLCFFILCYRSPSQVARLISSLHHTGDQFVLHVNPASAPDARSAFAHLTNRYEKVQFLEPQSLSWSHWSFADVQRRGIAFACEHANWDYFIGLSESCYPVRSISEIRQVLATAAAGSGASPNYVQIEPLGPLDGHFRRWFTHYWIMQGDRDRAIPLWRRRLPDGLDCAWKGSYWVGLHRSFCDWLSNDAGSGEVLRFLQHSKHASEFWLPWCLMNSPYRQTQRPSLHHIRWPGGTGHPKILTRRDLDEIVSSGAMFARKFDPAVDGEVLDLIDARCGRVRWIEPRRPEAVEEPASQDAVYAPVRRATGTLGRARISMFPRHGR